MLQPFQGGILRFTQWRPRMQERSSWGGSVVMKPCPFSGSQEGMSIFWGQEDRGASSRKGSLEEESIQLLATPFLGCCQSLSLRHLVILLAWSLCSALPVALIGGILSSPDILCLSSCSPCSYCSSCTAHISCCLIKFIHSRM